MLNFLRHYGIAKAQATGDSLLSLLVTWDPKGASEADLRVREDFLNKVGSQLVGLRRQFDVDSKDFDNKLATNAQRLAAAEDLQHQVDALPIGSPERTKLEGSLSNLVGVIESSQSDLDQAKHDKGETEAWLKERETAYQEALNGLRNAKSALAQASRDLARAGERRDREVQRADDARANAGLRPSNNKLDTALNAMRAATEAANREADEARLKQDSFKSTTDAVTEDPAIADALARAAGKDTKPLSVSDRLAALKARAA